MKLEDAKVLVGESSKQAKGRQEYDDYLHKKHISYKERCLAACFYCMGGYMDGKMDCKCEACPLYTVMPYRGKGEEEDGN